MKKKAAMQLSFGFIFALLIITAILFAGIKGLSVLFSSFSQTQKEQFVSDLMTVYKQTLRLPSGSSVPVKIATSNFEKLCFYNKEGSGDLTFLRPFEHIINNDEKNVFGISGSKLFPLTRLSLSTSEKEFCLNKSLKGQFNFTFVSRGNSVDIK